MMPKSRRGGPTPALRWFADERVAAVAPLVLQNDPQRRARALPPLIDSAGDEYDRGGFARKRGHGQECEAAIPLRARQRVRRIGLRSVLSPRRDPPRRRFPRALQGVLRGRGSLVPAPATGLRDRSRAGLGGVASRVRQLRPPAVAPSPRTAVLQRGARLLAECPRTRTVRSLPRHAAVLGAEGDQAVAGATPSCRGSLAASARVLESGPVGSSVKSSMHSRRWA